jgi:polyhydroxybutyrate depolymerase
MKNFMKWNVWLLLITLSLTLVGCSVIDRDDSQGTTYTEHTYVYGGLERTYLLIVPEGTLSEPMPLILALHGGGGTARSMCAMPGGLAEPAQRAGYLLVCPQGFERHWNDGRDIQAWQAHAQGIDDVGFLMGLIGKLSDDYWIDPDRIYATGISNGGQMSYRLACERSETLRAIAPVVASMATTLDCTPTHPVSVLVINGTEDPLVPYSGGEIRAMRRALGTVKATSDVFEFWAQHNRCEGETLRRQEPDLDPLDGTQIWHIEYQTCLDAQVILKEVEGGGHTWPGANQYLPVSLIGRLSMDISASDVIIDFFDSLDTNTDS